MRWSSLMSTSVFLFIWLFAQGGFVVTSLIMPCNIYNAKKRDCKDAIPYFSCLVLRLGIEPRSKV